MNLIMNGIDAMKDVDGVRELAIKIMRRGQRTESQELLLCVSDTGMGLPPQKLEQRSSMRSSPPRPRGLVWDCPSAAPSLNRMEAVCGPGDNSPRAEPVFT